MAAFINSHERPQDPCYEGSIASTAEAWHSHECLYNSKVGGNRLGQGTN